MYNGKTVSLKEIMWRVTNHPLMKDLNYDDAAMYAIEALRLINSSLTNENKITNPPIKIDNHKSRLPKDLITIRGVKDANSNIAYKYSTDIYHADSCAEDFGQCIYKDDYTYIVQNDIIITSNKECEILISYQSLMTDDEGYPLISDNQQTKEAIRYYIMYSHLEPLYDIGKVTDKAFHRIEQNYLWYMGAAQSSTTFQGLDHLESTMNALNRIIINNTEHARGFRTMNKKEINKKYL